MMLFCLYKIEKAGKVFCGDMEVNAHDLKISPWHQSLV